MTFVIDPNITAEARCWATKRVLTTSAVKKNNHLTLLHTSCEDICRSLFPSSAVSFKDINTSFTFYSNLQSNALSIRNTLLWISRWIVDKNSKMLQTQKNIIWLVDRWELLLLWSIEKVDCKVSSSYHFVCIIDCIYEAYCEVKWSLYTV